MTFWFALILPLTATAHAPKDGDIRLTGVVSSSRSIPRGHAFAPAWFHGFGLIATGDLDYHGGIEISAFYLRQMYALHQDGRQLVETGKRLYMVMGYRHWPTTWASGGAGLYSSYSMGDPRVEKSDFTPVAEPRTSAHDATDYGLDFSLQIEPWSARRWALVGDARYSRSLTAKEGESADFWAVHLGLKYLIQERVVAGRDR